MDCVRLHLPQTNARTIGVFSSRVRRCCIRYADLLEQSRIFLLSNRGHAPNQDVANVLAALLANLALPTLNASSRALPADQMMTKVSEVRQS
mgnify:CR=1 FL=1